MKIASINWNYKEKRNHIEIYLDVTYFIKYKNKKSKLPMTGTVDYKKIIKIDKPTKIDLIKKLDDYENNY